MNKITDVWEVKKFQDISKIIDGDRGKNYPNKNDFLKNNYCLFLNTKNVTKNSFVFNDVVFITKEKDLVLSKGKAERNDIILTTRGTIGNTAIYNDSVKYENIRINSGMVLLRSGEKIFSEYFIKFLSSEKMDKQFFNIAYGSAQSQLTVKDIKKFKIPLPPLPEQKRIVGVLEVWDEYLEKLKSKIDVKKNIKKYLMQELLTGKKRLKGFDGEWVEKKLGEISEIKKGEQLNKEFLIDDGEFPSYSGGVTPSGYTNNFNTEKNKIIISEGGNSCGYINFIKRSFWAGGHCYVISENQEIDKYFLFNFLKFSEIKIMRLRVGSGLPNVQKKDIDNFKIKFPKSLEEQKAIAAILMVADEELEGLLCKQRLLEEQKRFLLNNLISGVIRVPENLVANN